MTRTLILLPLMLVISLLMGCGGGSSNPTTPSLDNLGASGGIGSVNGNSADDDGTADQGSGDAPGTPGSDDSADDSSDDDGTPDQGSGDAPGTPGSDDSADDSGDDDGTDDQGGGNDDNGDDAGDDSGDDDGTPDQGSGDH